MALDLINSEGVVLAVERRDGQRRPFVLVHGWPLAKEAWAPQLDALAAAGHSVVAYDRRGFGGSAKPADGYDYDTLADDLHAVMETLDLRDAVLVGFSMGGGDVARYLTRHGHERVAGVVYAASVTPALAIRDDNPDGAMPQQGFDELADSYAADPSGFLDGFVTQFFSNDEGVQVDQSELDAARTLAAKADPRAAEQCIRIWGTDLRADVAGGGVPVLVVHGTGDQNVPFEKSAARMREHVPNAEVVALDGGPHGINVAQATAFNDALLAFAARL